MKKHKIEKQIIHLDIDAFYPSVEVLDNPKYIGKPVIVGGSKERGVVSSASYDARKFGIHSAQPIAKAIRLCPDGIFLPCRMSRYKKVSNQVFEIFHRFTPLVEPLSIDEAFLDVTGSTRLFGSPIEIAQKIRNLVVNEIGLTVSAGIAPSKFVAKIASDIDKPDGLTVVTADKVREFLDPLPIGKMWGVGKVTQKALNKLNINTFQDLRQFPVSILEKNFGKNGQKMHWLAMGIDERDVVPRHDIKSIGHEQTFPKDIIDPEIAARELLTLSGMVARRLRREGLSGKTITLKVKYGDFVQVTRSATLSKPTDDDLEIYSNAFELIKKTAMGKRPVRLLGISLSQLTYEVTGVQMDLFVGEKRKSEKRRDLHRALDSLHEKYGQKGVRPGSLITGKNHETGCSPNRYAVKKLS